MVLTTKESVAYSHVHVVVVVVDDGDGDGEVAVPSSSRDMLDENVMVTLMQILPPSNSSNRSHVKSMDVMLKVIDNNILSSSLYLRIIHTDWVVAWIYQSLNYGVD